MKREVRRYGKEVLDGNCDSCFYAVGGITSASFPTYGERTESFKATSGNDVVYVITFREKNIVVTVIATNLSQTETKNYCDLVVDRVKSQ